MYNMFRIGAEIFDNLKVRIQNFKARRQALLGVCFFKSQYMYEYIIEIETPLSELKTFLTCKRNLSLQQGYPIRSI